MNDHLWENLHLSGPATMEPGVIQDFDFENWTEADRGWRSYVDLPDSAFRHLKDMFSPAGISWEQAKAFIYKFANPQIQTMMDQAQPGQPWRYDVPPPGHATWAIEKVQD